jgi:hypothetical protein
MPETNIQNERPLQGDLSCVLPKLTAQYKHNQIEFAEWAQNNGVSFNNVWFSDEAHFHLDGVVNKKKCDFGRQRIHV